MASLMKPEVFRKMLNDVLTDTTFQKDIRTKGFQALESRGYRHGVPTEVQATLEKALFTSGPVARRKPRCGVCGVCGACGLCGEINFGSASAALWAAFALALTD